MTPRVKRSSGVLTREVRAMGASLTFLTRLPVSTSRQFSGDDLARGSAIFPLVGFGIGALTGVVAALASIVFPHLLAASLAVVAGLLLTGALPVDGLADTADGLGACSRERALAVMRESTIGTYGVVAIVIDLLLRVAALDALLFDHKVILVATLAGGLSRVAPVTLSALLPYARSDGGLGEWIERVSHVRTFAAIALGVGPAVLLGHFVGLYASIVTLAIIGLLSLFFRRWLGGFTGDALGGSSELCEIVVLLVALAIFRGH